MKKRIQYIYSSNHNTLSKLLEEVPKSKRHLFALIDDKAHLFRVACQSTIITDDETLVTQLYEFGADHIFIGSGFWSELCNLSQSPLNESFIRNFSSLSYLIKADSNSPDPRELELLLQGLNQASLPILLRGESGTGKTYLAKALHEFNGTKGEFISKNLSEISPSLLESELFGHAKGAFTGASTDKVGLLERVHSGTLFLDEIATLGLEQQAKLLKVLEEKEFSPVGSNKVIKVGFQLITATCEHLESLLNDKKIRPDFYNRIAGFSYRVPSLREVSESIPGLLEHFQKGQSRRLYFTAQCLEDLRVYNWPGNIRELRHWLMKARANSHSVIQKGPQVSKPSQDQSPIESSVSSLRIDKAFGLSGLVQEVESHFFDLSYKRNRGRPNKICEELMISKSVFYRLLKEHPSSRLEKISS